MLKKCVALAGCPGRAERSTRARRLLLALLRLLGLFRLLRLLRFLSHSILSRFNGWKRDTRHARRRASLAISSNTIPTDSRRAAPHRHVSVIPLSTVVMLFAVFSPPSARHRRERSAHGCFARVSRVNNTPMRDRAGWIATAARVLHEFKTTASIAAAR